MPPRDMMFRDTPFKYMSKNVPMTDTGIAIPTMAVARASRRNPNRTMMAMMPPSTAALLTASTADEMKRD